MTRRASPYSREFREEVLRLAESSEKSISELERDLGLSEGLIQKWRERYRPKEQRPVQLREREEPQPPSVADLEAQIRALKRENETLRQEREILKKAIGVFSKEAKQ